MAEDLLMHLCSVFVLSLHAFGEVLLNRCLTPSSSPDSRRTNQPSRHKKEADPSYGARFLYPPGVLKLFHVKHQTKATPSVEV
jgi:hypothetical protein